jgi:hypothetical protein
MKYTWAIMLLVPSITSAQTRVVVEDFSGASGAVVRTQVVGAIERSDALVVNEQGDVIVSGRVMRAGRRWRARVVARSTDGTEIVSRGFAARRVGALTGVVRAWTRSTLVPAIEGDRNEPAPAPAVEVAPREAEPARPRRATAVAPPAQLPAPIAMSVGMSVMHRSFGYNDDLFESLRPYELPAAPLVHASLEYFPGAHGDLGIMRGLSVIAEGEYAIGVDSQEGDTTFATDAFSVHAGLRWSLDVDDVAFRIDAGYRAVVFTIHAAADGQTRAEIPNVEIHALRFGGAFRWDIGVGLFFAGQGAYLHPLALGEIGGDAWFPRASAGGVEGDLGMGYAEGDVELRGAFTFRRFFYDMNSEPGDARVAGGAVDEYLGGNLSFVWSPRL